MFLEFCSGCCVALEGEARRVGLVCALVLSFSQFCSVPVGFLRGGGCSLEGLVKHVTIAHIARVGEVEMGGVSTFGKEVGMVRSDGCMGMAGDFGEGLNRLEGGEQTMGLRAMMVWQSF